MNIMEIVRAVVLAIVQGLTEFLPISSSGHLAITDAIFPGSLDNLKTFIVFTHFGTMIATIWVFWDDIVKLFKSLLTIPKAIKEKKMNAELKTVLYIVIASVPTGAMGFFLADKFDSLTGNILLIGAMLILTGFILLVPHFVRKDKNNKNNTSRRTAKNFGWWRSLILGVAQGLAIIPGISRSGTTISTMLLMKSERKFAGRLSFLISLPAISAATMMELVALKKEFGCLTGAVGIVPLIVSMLVAFGVGLLALKLLLKLVEKGKFYLFSFYCFAVGITVVVLNLVGMLG